jgi:hypothetical protein
MHNHWLFIGNVIAHLVASMSGLASFAFSLWEHSRQKKLESRVFFIVGFICLIVAFDQAWQDEHRNSQVLIAEKSSLASENEFWKSQSYQKDAALRSLNGLLVQNFTTLSQEQQVESKTQEAGSDAQKSLAQLASKILDINTPIQQKTTVIFFDKDESKSPAQARFLLLTNVNLTPVRMNVQCNYSMQSVAVSAVGALNMGGASRLSSTVWEANISSPAWTPTLPLLATITYSHLGDLTCAFPLK